MFAQERFNSIVSLLDKHRKMTVHELQQELQVSPATLRRDLRELESSDKIIRVRGAIVHPHYFGKEPSFEQKSRVAAQAKQTIAQNAASLVPKGSTVMIDAGSTCLEVGRLLLTRSDLTLITHSLPLAMLAQEAAAKMICIGGEVRSISGATVGSLALSWLDHLHADWCFVGTSGLSRETGLSTTELQEAAMKQAVLRRAHHKVLVADASKWGNPATIGFASWSGIDIWVTDNSISPLDAQNVHEQGPEVFCCPVKSSPK